MRATHFIALFIALAAIGWLASGYLSSDHDPDSLIKPSLSEENKQSTAGNDDRPVRRVRAMLQEAQPVTRMVTVRGRTETNRGVNVRAEIPGRIVALLKDKGDAVRQGETICRIDAQDRHARLREAEEAANQAKIDYEGALKLKRSGLQSVTNIAAAKARLASAQANLVSRRLDIRNLEVRAPFDGAIAERDVELGDYLQPGTVCARIVEQHPLLVTGQVSEQDVAFLNLGQPATATLMSGQSVSGAVTFIGREASTTTRTYPLEIEVPNEDLSLRAGITADLHVPVSSHMAHQVSPGILALDDEGRIGIRIINADDAVEFHHVAIIRQESNGALWVSGLPRVAKIITVGQELVVAGQSVEAIMENREILPIAQDQTPGIIRSAEEEPATPDNLEASTDMDTRREARAATTSSREPRLELAHQS